MLKRLGFIAIVGTGLLLQTTCGSVIPRRKGPVGEQYTKVDLSLVKFAPLGGEDELSVADYFEQDKKKQFVLLMFGSVSCATCNAKAMTLTADYLPSDELFTSDEYKAKFQMIGITTDSGGNELRFTQIWSDPKQRHARGYDFYLWKDQGGMTAREHFLPQGVDFGVPYTVMLRRDGSLMWDYKNTDHYELADLIDRTKRTINGDSTGKDDDHQKPKPPIVVPDLAGLAIEAPGRLRAVNVNSCGGETQELNAHFTDKQVRIVHAIRDNCDSTCAANIAAIKAVTDSCDSNSTARSCAASNLITASTCARGDVLLGGKEFFDVFSTMFDWTYRPYRDDGGTAVGIPAPNGPLTFAFSDSGRLLFAREGAVSSAELKAIVDAPLATELQRPVGANFENLYGDALNPGGQPGYFKFDDWRKRSKYTIVNTFNWDCGGCVLEINHWSEPGNIVEMCQNDPGFCQIGLAEIDYIDEGQTIPEYFEDNKTKTLAKNIKLPLIADSVILDGGLHRLYEGYLLPRHYSTWGTKEGAYNGTAIYDQEGKIIHAFSFGQTFGGDKNLVLDTMKKLKK